MSKYGFACLLLFSLQEPVLYAQFNIGQGEVKILWMTHCSACHGQNMEGTGQGSSLLDDLWQYGSRDEEMAKIIGEGIPATEMIPWKYTLKEEQIRSLVIYIKEQRLLIDREALSKRLQPKDGIFHSEKHAFELEKVAEGQLPTGGDEETDKLLDATLWSFVFLPDQSILATQRDGSLWHFRTGHEPVQIKDTPSVWHAGGESGLFDIVLHPQFEENGWVYLALSESYGEDAEGNPLGNTAVLRGRIRKGQWIDQEVIYRAPERFHTRAIHHFGGRLYFKDEYLYFSYGDRADMLASQDLASPFGKIHRVHDDGRIPQDNPFVFTNEACQSIWTYGNRNTQGLDSDPNTGNLWSTDHGPRGGDEVNLLIRGANYGWPLVTHGMNYNGKPITHLTEMEGTIQPALQWTPSIACAGMTFYTGERFPAWKDSLFVGGMWAEELHRLEVENSRVVYDEIVIKDQGRVRHVVNGPDGYLYLSLTRGDPRKSTIYRMVPVN